MRDNKTHSLKIDPKYFYQVEIFNKRFELRKNDRNYKLHDIIELREYDNETSLFTGNWIKAEVTFILNSEDFKLLEDYVILSIRVISIFKNDSF